MSDNSFEEWFNSDLKLKAIINEIDKSGKPFIDQAKEAFYRLSELYNLPKFPGDAANKIKGVRYHRTVFEEVGILRYLEPDDDPRGIVTSVVYNIKNQLYVDIKLCAERHFGSLDKIPDEYSIYYSGQDADSKLCFLNDGESWDKEGVNFLARIANV